jgi:hypothetical protein
MTLLVYKKAEMGKPIRLGTAQSDPGILALGEFGLRPQFKSHTKLCLAPTHSRDGQMCNGPRSPALCRMKGWRLNSFRSKLQFKFQL